MILTVTLNPCLHKFVRFRGVLDGRVVLRPVETRFQAGGKGVNTARAVKALGGDALALTYVGGAIGALFAESLAGEGVKLDAVPMRRATRMSTMVFGIDTGQFREFLEAGTPVDSDEAEAMKRRFEERIASASLVTLNGSVPDSRLDDFFAWAVARARALKKRVLVDTYGTAAPLAAAAVPFLLKANRDEVRSSFGVDSADDAALDAFARAQLERGVEHVLVTAGAGGATLWSRDARGTGDLRDVRMEATSPHVTEVNPVGSGDAMLGALALEISRGRSVREALRLAAAAGAANAEQMGVCDVERSRIEELARDVRIEPS